MTMILIGRIVQLFLLSFMRTSDRMFNDKTHYIWLLIVILYVFYFVIHNFLAPHVTQVVYACYLIDFFMTLLSYFFFLYRI